ncbi:hypothetical protein [Gordonia sp. NPDC058843]|uniref:hypothetical protein n=1 Tax=Gordonia sp. NPDC058843 TaxID=3346648 RepID=UPI0036C4ED47
MTRVGRNGIQRSEKVARRENRKQRRQHRAIAGAAALATVAAIGAGQVAEPAVAEASPISDAVNSFTNLQNQYGTNPLGSLLADLSNDGLAEVVEAWRIEMCASGASNGEADCSGSSTDMGGFGVAVVMPGSLELVPVGIYGTVQDAYAAIPSWVKDAANIILVPLFGSGLPDSIEDEPTTEGTSTVIGNGFQFAMAYRNGDATAVSYLPVSLATAGASDGRKAFSFAVIGTAHAWNTDPLDVTLLGNKVAQIPGVKGVGCYGGLTAAHADGVGACANVAGTFDFRWKQPNGEVQFGLTDPTALLADPGGVLGDAGGEVLSGLVSALLGGEDIDFDSDWFSLSKDFARLSIGGDHDLFSGNFLRLTSDYGFTGPITVDWLGSKVTFRPLVEVNGELRPNRLGLPVIEFGQLDTGELVPVIRIPAYELPFGLPASDPIDTGASNIPARASLSSDAASVEQSATTALDTSEVTTGDETDVAESYVGKHRSAEDSYVGKHRAPGTSDDSGSGGSDSDDSDAPDSETPDTGIPDSDGADSGAADPDTADSGDADTGSGSDSNEDSGDAAA